MPDFTQHPCPVVTSRSQGRQDDGAQPRLCRPLKAGTPPAPEAKTAEDEEASQRLWRPASRARSQWERVVPSRGPSGHTRFLLSALQGVALRARRVWEHQSRDRGARPDASSAPDVSSAPDASSAPR